MLHGNLQQTDWPDSEVGKTTGMSSEQSLIDPKDTSRVPVQDIVVDMLGSLVPGILYVTALFPAIISPLNTLIERITGGAGHLFDTSLFSPFSTTVAIAFAAFGVIFAYVIGHLFFRQNPAAADSASWNRVKKADEEDPGDYPYLNLKEELSRRGLDYLAKRVPWSLSVQNSHHRRTKHFVNALKIRIGLSLPGKIGTIARNEAHIRLSSSLWHSFRALQRPATAGLAIGVLANLVSNWQFTIPWPPATPTAMILPSIVLAIISPVTRAVERTLRYQRRREIFFILETAYWAGKGTPPQDFFEGLDGNPKAENGSRNL